ncbi:MAG: hypothetical protein MUC62_08960 [Candidatus Thermoplasmatota archaeon]|nr:hypothetical protein [Candidatus Thermoplasmatota archaeon]
MILFPILIIALFSISGQPISDSKPILPEEQVIVPVIVIRLIYAGDMFFYDNSPIEVILTYEIYCYIPPETPPGAKCEVDLTGTAEEFLVSPIDTMVFDYMIDTLQFTTEVTVPPDAPAGRNLAIIVSGTYKISPGQGEGEVTPLVAEMTIPYYGCIQLSAETPDQNPPVGNWVETEITIHNMANAEDAVTLDVFKGDPNVEVRFSDDIIKVNGGASTRVSFAMRQKDGLPETNHITIRARSSHQGLNATRYCEISFETKVSHKSFLAGPLLYIGGGSMFLLVILTLLIITVTIRWNRRKAKNSRPL